VRSEILAGKNGDEIAPIDYSDNYISLWPGETKSITARYDSAGLHGKSAVVRVKGYNVPESFVDVAR
jgi:exo-1,4-beta-D-glucosaminidase